MGQVGVGREAVSIDDDLLGAQPEAVEGTVHGQDTCAEDVDAVNLVGFDDAQCPCLRLAFYDLAECVALLFGELFGVVQQVVSEVGGQYDGCREDGSGQASPACFVASGFYDAFVEVWFEHFLNV